MAKKEKTAESKTSLADVISTAIRIPGVKVDRDSFLREQFKNMHPDLRDKVVALGPVKAGIDESVLDDYARDIINERTLVSTGASFLAGIPGGFAMAATIPADLAQFYGIALRMAQELAYLYGEEDLWEGKKPDSRKVRNQLILYCGVMLGASGAAQTVRVMSSALAKEIARRLPQKALTKTFYYPVIKSVLRFFGINITKQTFAKGVSKVVPLVGGVVSGGITFATLKPMGKRLAKTLHSAHFGYTAVQFEADWREINKVYEEFGTSDEYEDIVESEEADEENTDINTEDKVLKIEVSDAEPVIAEESCDEELTTQEQVCEETSVDNKTVDTSKVIEEIGKAKQMLDAGIINEEEFAVLKSKLLSQL